MSPGGSGPPVNAGGTNVVSVTGNQTVALTSDGDQITADAGNNTITVTGSPTAGDFVDGGGNTNVFGANGMQPGVDILELTQNFAATGSNALIVRNFEQIKMTGASNKHIVFDGSATVTITADGNGNDRYMVSGSDSQNQKLMFQFGSGRQLQSSDLIDLGGGIGDRVQFISSLEVSVANVENVVMSGNSITVHLTSAAGSNNRISVQQNDTIDLTQSAGNDIITQQFGSTPANVAVTGFNAAVDRIKLNRGQFNGDADSDGAIDSGKLLIGAGVTAPGDADDFWIFNTTTKELFYDSDGNGGNSTDIKFDFDNLSTVDGSNIASVIALISSAVPEFS